MGRKKQILKIKCERIYYIFRGKFNIIQQYQSITKTIKLLNTTSISYSCIKNNFKIKLVYIN